MYLFASISIINMSNIITTTFVVHFISIIIHMNNQIVSDYVTHRSKRNIYHLNLNGHTGSRNIIYYGFKLFICYLGQMVYNIGPHNILFHLAIPVSATTNVKLHVFIVLSTSLIKLPFLLLLML